MMVDAAIAQSVAEILNETYKDRVEQILSFESVDAPGFDEPDLVGVATDGAKRIAFRLNETRAGKDQIVFRLLNPEDIKGGDSADLSDPLPEQPPQWQIDLEAAGDRLLSQWSEALRARLITADTPEAAQEILRESYGLLPSVELSEAMVKSFQAAYSEGYLEADGAFGS